MPKSNRVRAHPKAALQPAVASGCCRRAPPPPISSAKQESGGGLAVGQHRRPGRPGIRRAPFGARTPTIKSPITQPEMPERTHATDPLGQRFRSGRAAADPIAARRRRRIESAGRGAALACARKRPSEAERGPLTAVVETGVLSPRHPVARVCAAGTSHHQRLARASGRERNLNEGILFF